MQERKYELVKFNDEGLELEVTVSPKEETIWLTQDEIGLLFGKARNTITEHINKIYKNNELVEELTCRKNRRVKYEGNKRVEREVKIYNLDLIILVGYRVNSIKAQLFRKWANQILKKYLLQGYVINENRVTVSNENFNNLLTVVNDIQSNQINISKRVEKLEDKVFDKEYGLNKIFYNGQFYDSYTLIQSIFENANKEIIIIDNYIDRSILDRLVVKKNNVNVNIYTNISTSKLLNKDITIFNYQYGNLNINYTTKVHDSNANLFAIIIIDQTKLYHLGHSIKDLGKKIYSINELESNLIKMLLNSI